MQKTLRTFVVLAAVVSGLAFSLPVASRGGADGPPWFMGLHQIKDQLNLTPSQQTQWDAAVAASKSAHATIRTGREQIKQALQTELVKTEPDLVAVAALADSLRPADEAARQQARNAWLQLYATFSVEQKTAVKNFILTRMQRMERFREQMKHDLPNG